MKLTPILKLDGEWIDAEAAAKRGLALTESSLDGVRHVSLDNRSGATVRPEELGWRKSGGGDFDVPGLRLYVEGWQMASPCGVRRWNDEPFDYSTDYLPNCVSTPGDFHPGERGRFLSDNVCCLRRPDGRMRLFGPVVGIVDAMRSSTDITPYWDKPGQHAEAPNVPNVCRNVVNHAYMNGRLWINDPDTLIVRDDNTKLTRGEVELWERAVAFAGGSLLLSDKMTTLSPDRLALVRRAPLRIPVGAGRLHVLCRWGAAWAESRRRPRRSRVAGRGVHPHLHRGAILPAGAHDRQRRAWSRRGGRRRR